MRVLGVDPGFRCLGLAVIDATASALRIRHHETFLTRTSASAEVRLDAVFDRLITLIEELEPVAVGYENQAGVEAGKALAAERQGKGEINASSRRVHEVAGGIRCAARLYDLPVYCLAPSTIKVAFLGKGCGRAGKAQVQRAVRVFFRVQGTLSEHAADGIATAVATVRAHRAEQARHRAALRLIT